MALAGIHAAAISSPAFAQGGVQPVPYGTSQPVPYDPAPARPAPSAVAPTNAGTDVIHLKSGGMLRGTIVDVIPGSHARIQLPTGEIAMVQWSEIARIENGAPAPTGPAPAPAPAPRPPTTEPTLLVHIDSPRPVRLERFDAARSGWEIVCSSPCDKQLPVEGEYRVAGSGIKTTGRFGMSGKAGERVVIEVNPASKGWFITGIVGTGLGAMTAVIGLYVVLVGAVGSTIDKGFCSGSSSAGCSAGQTSSESVKAAGWTITAIGGALAGAGVIAMAVHWSSTTAQEVQVPIGPAPTNDAFRRDPIWHDTDVPRAMPKQQVFVPIFSGAF